MGHVQNCLIATYQYFRFGLVYGDSQVSLHNDSDSS